MSFIGIADPIRATPCNIPCETLKRKGISKDVNINFSIKWVYKNDFSGF